MICNLSWTVNFDNFTKVSYSLIQKIIFSTFIQIWAGILSLRGLNSIIVLSNSIIAKKFDNFHARNAIPYLNTCKTNILCLMNDNFFGLKCTFWLSKVEQFYAQKKNLAKLFPYVKIKPSHSKLRWAIQRTQNSAKNERIKEQISK